MSFKATFENSSPVTDLHYLYLLAITINSLFFRLDPCISCMTQKNFKENKKQLIIKLRKFRDQYALALKSFRRQVCAESCFSQLICTDCDIEKPLLWSLKLEFSLTPSFHGKAGAQSYAASMTCNEATIVFQSSSSCFVIVIPGYYSSVLGKLGREEPALSGCLSSQKILKYKLPHCSVSHERKQRSFLSGIHMVFCAKWCTGLFTYACFSKKIIH